MLRSRLSANASLIPLLDLEGEPGSGGGDVTPAPSPAPAPAPAPTVLTDDPPAGDPPADDPPADDPPAPTEEERRASLSDEERTEEDRRAALTDEERAAEDEAAAKAQEVPEEYKFALEGEDAPQLDEELLGEFTGILKEDGMTQAQADRYMGFAQKLQEKWLGQITEAHVTTRTGWREAAAVDAEIGGEKFAENAAIAKEALNEFGSPALKELLNETGIGDHPEVIRAFYNVGVVNREHGFVKSGRIEKSQPFYDHPTSQPRK